MLVTKTSFFYLPRLDSDDWEELLSHSDRLSDWNEDSEDEDDEDEDEENESKSLLELLNSFYLFLALFIDFLIFLR